MKLPGDLTGAGSTLKPHGYRGHIKVSLLPGVELPETGKAIFIEITGKPVPFFIEEFRITGNDIALVKLRDVNDKEEAMRYSGCRILLPESELPDPEKGRTEEYSYLTGFSLYNYEPDELIGRVGEFVTHGIQQFLVVEGTGGKEVLIPFHTDLLVEINRESKKIIMDLPDGLTGLQ